MPVLSSLVKDHWLLRRMLNALSVYADQIADAQSVPRDDLRKFADFFQKFGDEHHAEKEEEILLPFLARSGADWQNGPVAQARREHRQERYFLRVLNQLAEQDGEYDLAAQQRLINELQGFIADLRAHLSMEDEQLFPLARQLDEAQRAELNASLARFDASAQSLETIRNQSEIVDELMARYSV